MVPPARNAVWLAGDAPISAAFTGSVLPRSPFRRPTSGSSWLGWRPVIGTAPGGSAGQLDYRQTTSPPTGQRGAGDARAPLSLSPTSRSLRLAYGSWIALAQGPGLEPDFAPTLARQSRARLRPQRRSRDASWCSPPHRFRPQHGHAICQSILTVKQGGRNPTNYVHRHRCPDRRCFLRERDRSGRSDRPDSDFCCEFGKTIKSMIG